MNIIKEKLKLSKIGTNNPMYGKPGIFSGRHHSEETINKMRVPKSEKHKQNLRNSVHRGADSYCARSVICITTGMIFDTVKEASEYYCVDRSSITKCCRHNIKSAGKIEGIKFLLQNNITDIIESDDKRGKVGKIKCIKTKLIQKEGEKRAVPIDIDGSTYIIDMDMVIMAVGSKTDKSILEKLDLKTNERGYILVDENNMTSKDKIFAGGDLIGEKSTVAWAAKSGRDVANKIIEYLNKKDEKQ
jgi:NADPH-dependent glutamate synthase beta subunit-like oxidoreductase